MQTPTGPRGEDSDDSTRIIEEFIRLHDAGHLSLDEYCARFPEEMRKTIRRQCVEILNIRKVLDKDDAETGGWRDPIGKRLGEYKIIREIGRGGMGVVFLAEQLSLKRQVALKVLPHELTLSQRRLQRFEREAEAAARLTHDGIVHTIQYGSEAGMYYLAMEYIEGSNLYEVLQDLQTERAVEGASSPAAELSGDNHPMKVAEIIARIADALHYAHERGVIHRDIKPQNILIDAGCRPHVLDFGLAKLVDEASISRSGDIAGTPYYMSPEQALAKRVRVDHRTDIFSLGVVFYELLSLRRPFEGTTSQQVLYEISFRDPTPVRRLNPKVPRDLAVLCTKALEKDPDHRFQDAQELARELHRFQAGEPIISRPPSRLERVRRGVKRNRGAVLAGVSILAALAIGIWMGPGTHGASVTIDAPGSPGARVSYIEIDPITGKPGTEEVQLGGTPVEESMEVDRYYRFIIEGETGYSEITRFIEDEEEIYSYAAVIKPTEDVTGDMELIPAGEFTFGSDDPRTSTEHPNHERHTEYLDAFWIDTHEVSNGKYLRFIEETDHQRPAFWPEDLPPGWEDLPVTGIFYADKLAYANWAGKRLPTELEWEKAARGPDGREVPWSQTFAEGDSYEGRANVGKPGRKPGDLELWEFYFQSVVPVDDLPEGRSTYGLFHTLGNVWEQTETLYTDLDENGEPTFDGKVYTAKGLGWSARLPGAVLSDLGQHGMSSSNHQFGFRCAKSVRQ